MSFHRPMQSVVILSIAVLVLSQAVMAGEKKAIATDPLPTSAVSRLGTLRGGMETKSILPRIYKTVSKY